MTHHDKITALILKLNRDTVSGEITWEISDPPHSLTRGSDEIISLYLTTNIKGQLIALYECRVRHYSVDFDEIYWGNRITLAFIDSEDRITWERNETSGALYDLYENARRKAANVDSIIDDFLSS